MGGSKKLKQNEVEEEFDFNDSKVFGKIVSEISNEKMKNAKGISLVPKNIISFLTGNVKSVAILAVYFLISGLILNSIWLINLFNNYFLVSFISVLSLVAIVLLRKLYIKIKKWAQQRKK